MDDSRANWQGSLSDYESLVAALDEQATAQGSAEFVRFPERTLTFQGLADRSRSLAAGFAARGVEAGDRVCLFMYNRAAFLETFFAVQRLGAIPVPLNVSLKGQDLVYALEDSQPAAVVLGPDRTERYADVRDTVAVDEEFVAGEATSEYEPLSAVTTDGEPAPDVDLTPTDPASIIYTSGTTGMPKGVVLPHGSYLTIGTELAERIIQPTEEDTLYMSQPLFHIFAQIVVAEALLAGVPLAMERWFSSSKFWDRVERHDATVIHFSTAISDILYEETEAPDNPVRVGYGAIADDIQAPFGEKFDCQVLPLYGLTECGGIALSGTVDDPQTGSLGVPTRYTDVAVVDENDEPVPTGEEGELVIRSTRPNVLFERYLGKPEKTVDDLRNQWLHTGDIGYRDEEGAFHFVSRKAHFLRRKGENVSAFEVERVVDEHPAVEKSIVVGVDADVGGEEVLAAVKTVEDTEFDPLDLIKHCEEQLAYFKVPRYVRVVEEFPRTETKGSIERHEIAASGAEGAWDLQETGYQLER